MQNVFPVSEVIGNGDLSLKYIIKRKKMHDLVYIYTTH